MRILQVLFFGLFFTVFATTATAQLTTGNPNFAKGDIDINAGIGLLQTYYNNTSTVMPPLSVSAEYGVTDKISVGGFIGYSTSKEEFLGGQANYSFLIIGARGSYHFKIWDKMDTYAGLMLGYNNVTGRYDSTFDEGLYDFNVAASGMALSGYVGGRYNIKDNISAYAEIGYGISVLNLGVSFKLGK